jgi:hypothetical protein
MKTNPKMLSSIESIAYKDFGADIGEIWMESAILTNEAGIWLRIKKIQKWPVD